MPNLFREFVKLNIRACDWIEARLPTRFTRSLLYAHELKCADLMNDAGGRWILDVGGGHGCPYAHHRQDGADVTLVGLDILFEQVRNNKDIDIGLVGDAQNNLPFRGEQFDLVSSRSVFEHLKDNEPLIQETNRILNKGGRTAHVFPCKFSPFAIINQILPNKVAQKILYAFFPGWSDECGFKAYYSNCTYGQAVNLFRKNGFEIDTVELRYYQSIYFKFFVPFYLVSLTYDLLIWALDIKTLCAQVFLVARKV